MPYIKKQDRQKYKILSAELPSNKGIDLLEEVAKLSKNVGDLNYAITMILKNYMMEKGECYATHNEIIGMLECCKTEWYRKRTAPYEDIKEYENGRV